MKSLTKWLFCFCLPAWLATGCDSKSNITITDPHEVIYETHYIYKNESSFDIEIVYTSATTDRREGESVQIKRGDEYKVLQTNNPGNFSPLNLLYPEGGTGRITISNEIVELSYRSIHTVEHSVYDEQSYVRTKDEKNLLYLTYYTYTFTDDCFKDGTPIGEKE